MASDFGILKGKYPAKAHAKRVAKFILDQGGDKNGVLYLEGQKVRMIEVSYFALFLPFSRWARLLSSSRMPLDRNELTSR
jgi:hypothetical protein